MKIKMLILNLLSFFKFLIFPYVTLIEHIWTFFIKVFSETTWFRIMKSLTILIFSESVTTSDGYRRGYMSFAHFLLYLMFALDKIWAVTYKNTIWLCKNTQISLSISSIWSKSSLSIWRKDGPLVTPWAHSKDCDQNKWMSRLIWVYAGRTATLLFFSCRSSIMEPKPRHEFSNNLTLWQMQTRTSPDSLP